MINNTKKTQKFKDLGHSNDSLTWFFSGQDDSRPPLYEETTRGQVDREGDSSEDEEEDGPPPEPTRFGWVQGVMVGLLVALSI